MTTTGPHLVLPDTNILVHYARRSPLYNRIEATYSLAQLNPPPILSIVTHGEALSLAAQFGWGRTRRQELQQFVARCVTVNLDFDPLHLTFIQRDWIDPTTK